MIKILVVEDNGIVRQLLIEMLELQDDLKVVGAAENGMTALKLFENGLQSDIVLADLSMHGMDGIELTEKVTSLYDDVKVIILTMHGKADFLNRALAAGARGYILKNGDMNELFAAIRKVNTGGLVVGVDAHN